MPTLVYKLHYLTEEFKIFQSRWNLRVMLFEKGDNYLYQICSVKYFVAITVFMILSFISLEINLSALKKILQPVENFFVFLYQSKAKSWFNCYPSFNILFFIWIADINSKTTVSIH